MSTQKMIHILAQEWRCAGIEPGDTILIHSSISRVLRRIAKSGENANPEVVLDSLLAAVGEEGTLMLPLFNFDFTRGVPFDILSTPSHMGSLTEAGRKHARAVRTGHPIYSFAVIGRHSNKFEGVDNYSGYGSDSPFAILRELDGKIGVIDLPDQNSMTFYHHVEEMLGVDYRFHKTFKAPYIGSDRVPSEKEYGLFVRDFDKGVLTHVNPMGEILWDEAIYSGHRPKQGCGLRVARADLVFKVVSNIIKDGKAEGVLYATAK